MILTVILPQQFVSVSNLKPCIKFIGNSLRKGIIGLELHRFKAKIAVDRVDGYIHRCGIVGGLGAIFIETPSKANRTL